MKSPVNIWVMEGAKIYLATITYIVGTGPIAFYLDGEIIAVQQLIVMPGRRVAVGFNAKTSDLNAGVYIPGTLGEFIFSYFEMGKGCEIDFPEPMGVVLKVGEIVSTQFSCHS